MSQTSVKEIKNTAQGIGKVTDPEASGDGSIIGILKRIRALLGGTLLVQQTGSKMTEILLDTAITLPAGASVLIGTVLVNDCAYFGIGIDSVASFTPGYDVGVRRWAITGVPFRLDGTVSYLSTGSSFRSIVDPVRVNCSRVDVYIKNNDASDKLVDRVVIFKYPN